jgi:hypothetical protein
MCARFSERVGYPNAKAILQELFGAVTATAVFCLPNRLNRLAGSLPQGSSLTVGRMIEKYTILPFFSAFLPPERVNKIRKDMESGNGAAAHMRSGIAASRIKLPELLRFCPTCKRNDEKKFGDTYWHRMHQLPGIDTCPSHGVALKSSTASVRAGRQALLFVSAKDATSTIAPEPIHPTNRDNRILERLSRDAAWLIENPQPGTAPKVLQNRYMQLLIDRELATYTGSIHVTTLLAQFRRLYSPALLNQLNCNFTGRDQQKNNWLLRLVRNPQHSQHPLYHLLLLQFLKCTAKDFFRLPQELKFFGEGPWPCLNPAAGHFRRSVVQRCILSKRCRDNRPIGNFHCDCGFAYARSGPDSSSADKFRIGRIISLGPIWEAKLKELWKDAELSLSEIGRQLRVDPLTIRRHATQLDLPFSVRSRNVKGLRPSGKLKNKDKVRRMQLKRKSFRLRWRTAMKRERKSMMKTLRKRLPKVYAWLMQNDLEWMIKNRPKRWKNKRANISVDWKKRDSHYAGLVKQSTARIRNAPGRPERITRTAIGRDLGCVSLFQKYLHKLPISQKTLASSVETLEDFSIRRVWRAADYYRQEGTFPLPWQLRLRANVYRHEGAKKIRDAVEAAMKTLSIELSLENTATA